MTEQEDPILPPHVNFQELPLPELRFNGAKIELIAAEVVSGIRKKQRVVHLRFFTTTPGKQHNTYELVGYEHHIKHISRLLSENMPHTTVHAVTPYVTLTETPEGDVLVMLTEAGRKLVEEGCTTDILTEAQLRGTDARLTDKKEHFTLYPPFIVSGDRLWYYKPSQHSRNAFSEDVLRTGWVKMKQYRK